MITEDNNIRGSNEVLVKVENLSKKFCKDLKTSLKYGLVDLYSNLRGKQLEDTLRPKEFWAVKDISFTLKRGECLGLIGHNGAGKSTLLKILNGLINPDGGKVTMRGRVGALIELGAGFNPILTGRENIYNNGAVLGFTRAEIDVKVEEIIDFAELREFIDMPVQHYSSGMKVRLGFAVAAQMEPDVLIIDEVLAVGDLGFKLKCFKRIDEILPNTAIIFVSHNMPMVARICNQAILMDSGIILNTDKFNVSEAIDRYYRRFINNEYKVVFSDKTIELKDVEILKVDDYIEGIPKLNWLDDLCIRFDFKLKKPLKELPLFNIVILDKEQLPVAILESNNPSLDLKIEDSTLSFKAMHRQLQLSKGMYSLNVLVTKAKTNSPILRVNNVLSFQVSHKRDFWQPFLLKTDYE